VTFIVIQGYWCHSIGHIRFPIPLCLCLAPLKIYYHLFSKIKEATWHITHPFISCVHKYSCVSTSTRNLKCLASPIPKIWLGAKYKKTGHVTLSTTVCHRKPTTWYILPAYKIGRLSLQSFRRYDCGCRNWKMGHVTPTSLGVVCHP